MLLFEEEYNFHDDIPEIAALSEKYHHPNLIIFTTTTNIISATVTVLSIIQQYVGQWLAAEQRCGEAS